jgi:hypothetical protein
MSGQLLKSWDLKLFRVCGVMTDAVIWLVLFQSIGNVYWCRVVVGTEY